MTNNTVEPKYIEASTPDEKPGIELRISDDLPKDYVRRVVPELLESLLSQGFLRFESEDDPHSRVDLAIGEQYQLHGKIYTFENHYAENGGLAYLWSDEGLPLLIGPDGTIHSSRFNLKSDDGQYSVSGGWDRGVYVDGHLYPDVPVGHVSDLVIDSKKVATA